MFHTSTPLQKMRIPSSPCLPCFLSVSSFFFFFFIVIVSFPTFFCQLDEKELFRNCSTPFNCGENFVNISYPFWGGNRSSDCGLPGFHLTCGGDDYLTIDIGGRNFRIVNFSRTSDAITIARNDLWNDVCPENYENFPTGSSPFYPARQTTHLSLYYDCPYPDYNNSRNFFSCTNTSDSVDLFADYNNSRCKSSITVLALEGGIEEFNKTASTMTLRDLLYQGYSLEFELNWVSCPACQVSGGVCSSGSNSTGNRCLCSDGYRETMCPTAAAELGREPVQSSLLSMEVFAMHVIALSAIFILLACCCHIQSSAMKEDQKLEELVSKYGSLGPKRYSYSDVKEISKSFRNELGRGGFGTVYKGKLFDGRLVAVKILDVQKGNGEEFVNEVVSIGRTSHVNVVTLLGFCLERKRRALVYEYMPNGSLEKYIHGGKSSVGCNQLGMDKLYQIAVGVARGLEYLHGGCNTRILHFDIKPHNILLDENFSPKISDFGLAKQCVNRESMISNPGTRGTIGYIAPELVSTCFGGVSYKSDVYSYGMMILEIVGRRKNVDLETSHASEVYFPHWAYQHLVINQDLRLKGVVTPEEDEIARKIIAVGLWCIQSDPSQRPTMSKVIEMLEGDSEAIAFPPKPIFFGSPSTSPPQSSSATTIELS